MGLPPVLREVPKTLIHVLPHWLPAQTMTGTLIPEKSLEAQERRGLGSNLTTRVLVQGLQEVRVRNVTTQMKAGVMKGLRAENAGASRSWARQGVGCSPGGSWRNRAFDFSLVRFSTSSNVRKCISVVSSLW